jgi:hypothetical protein
MPPVLYAFLGWVAGLFSTVLLEWNRDYRQVKSLRTALRFELIRFRYRMAGVAFMMTVRQGTLTPQLIAWLSTEFATYTEPDKDQNIATALEALQQHPKEAKAVLANFATSASQKSPALKKYPTPALQTTVASVSLFSPKAQKEILELSTLVANFDAVVEEAWRFFQMTFDNALTPQSIQNVHANIETAYAQAGALAVRIAEQAARVLAAA